MNMKKIIWHIWDVLYPLLLYYAVLMFAFTAARFALGNDSAVYMYCQIIATIITIPVMYMNFYRVQHKLEEKVKINMLSLIAVVPIVACISIALNNLILMSPIVRLSSRYSEATSNFYTGLLLVELIGSGILTPILEELVFRGILYGRLKKSMNRILAIVVSSLLFALIHFNLVQFVYAFLLGIVLAIFVELSHSVLGAIIAHMVANIIAILRTELNWLDFMLEVNATMIALSILLLVGGIVLIILVNKKNK